MSSNVSVEIVLVAQIWGGGAVAGSTNSRIRAGGAVNIEGCSRAGILRGSLCGTGLMDAVSANNSVIAIGALATLL